MRYTTQLYRLLLAAFVLLMPPGSAAGASVRHSRGAGLLMRQAGVPGLLAGKYNPPAGRVLRAGFVTSSPFIGGGHSGGTGLPLRFAESPLLCFPPHTAVPAELRRWRLVSGSLSHALLTALYPAHGFW